MVTNQTIRASLILVLSLLLPFSSASCKANDETGTNDSGNNSVEDEKEATQSITDLVLIYGGGAHRTNTWDANHFKPYTSYTSQDGDESWLFDGFLFLEIVDGKGKIFATGYYGSPASQLEWKKLIEYYFKPDNAINALDSSVAEAEERLGKPQEKRKVVIGLPEPINPANIYDLPNDYWGEIDGNMTDFSKDEDRIKAVKWYIDEIIDSPVFRIGTP